MLMMKSADCSSDESAGTLICKFPLNGAINGFPSGAIELTSKVVLMDLLDEILATMQKEA